MFVILAFVLSVALASESYPKDIPTIAVICNPDSATFFECTPDWTSSNVEDVWVDDSDRIDRIATFLEAVKERNDAKEFFSYYDTTPEVYEGYPGSELYNDARTFYGLNDSFTVADFLGLSYFLDYYASNTLTVSIPEDKDPVVGFAGGLFPPTEDEEDEYTEDFMDAMRNVTVQYMVCINEAGDNTACTSDRAYYTIGYMGSFTFPYFFSGLTNNSYVGKFAVAYNMEKNWALNNNGSFIKFTNLFNNGYTRVIPAGIFMVNFIAPGNFEVNTKDPYGTIVAETGDVPEILAPIDFERFKYMMALRYGIRTTSSTDFMNNMFAYSADGIDATDRYDNLDEASWNFCRSLGRQNVADEDVKNTSENNSYDYVEPLSGTEEEFICNQNYLPSYFFMTHTLDKEYPFLFSTKYQMMVDGTCQYRTDLDSDGMPKTSKTNVSYSRNYGVEFCEEDDTACWSKKFATDSKIDGLSSKTIFVLNASDFFGLHVVDTARTGDYSSYYSNSDEVPTSYYYYELNSEHIADLAYDTLSYCNTAISDNYVLYDMKEYSAVYGSISGISSGSFGYENVYSSMKVYPTRTDSTAVITAASVKTENSTSTTEVKTQLQKCVNVFLDTSGEEVAACNDVTSTWDWGVFGGSMAGLIVVIGLWVWGGFYSKNFNLNNPPYYKDLVAYEPEWRRLDEEARLKKQREKAAKKGMTLPEPEKEESVTDNSDSRN